MKDIGGLQSLLYREEFMMSERAKVTSFIVKKHTPFLRATISSYSRGGSLVRLKTVETCSGPGYESGNSHK